MAKTSSARPSYKCAECGWTTSKWVGRCGECQAWGTVEEAGQPIARAVKAGPVSAPARPIAEIDGENAQVRPTGVDELDRVLGGGLVAGSVVLLAGEPGVGKSTLLLEAASRSAGSGHRVLYVTGEESAAQVRMRAGRIGALDPQLLLAAETDLASVIGHIETVQPTLLVVDSIQTIACTDVEGTAGGVTQVREATRALVHLAKQRGMATVIVGHVTKDGSIAGPRLLEHLVDVVLHFEGDRHSRLRLVRSVKNRFGPTDEIGCFDLTDDGIWSVPDPSGLFLSRNNLAVPGQCVTVTLEGRRPLVAEVQALVAQTSLPTPRRATSGLEGSRLAMVLAVLQRRAGVQVGQADVYVSTVGGMRIAEPAADLAVALAVAGAAKSGLLPGRLVAFGELGLAGEIRPITGLAQRLGEAKRLGFTRALVPPHAGECPPGIKITEVPDIHEALRLLRTVRVVE